VSSDATPTRPDPIVTRDSAFFWEGAERGELLGQACGDCGRFRHPPTPMCSECHSVSWNATPLSGRGTVYAWSIPEHPRIPMFDYPLVVALIDLDEGIRLLSNLCDIDPDEVETGMLVEVFFAPTAGGKAVPQFRPAAGRP
jgi:uncharacterized OB-fold protein